MPATQLGIYVSILITVVPEIAHKLTYYMWNENTSVVIMDNVSILIMLRTTHVKRKVRESLELMWMTNISCGGHSHSV